MRQEDDSLLGSSCEQSLLAWHGLSEDGGQYEDHLDRADVSMGEYERYLQMTDSVLGMFTTSLVLDFK